MRARRRVAGCLTAVLSVGLAATPVLTSGAAWSADAGSLNIVRQSPETITVDPDWSGSEVHLLVYGPAGAHELSWVLRDAQGKDRTGPQQVAATGTGGLDHVDLVPGATGPLDDGTYTLDFTATSFDNDTPSTATGSTQVHVVNNPPADRPRLTVVRRNARPDGGHEPSGAARFLVQTYPHSSHGTVRTYDDAGRLVASSQVLAPCWARGCTTSDSWDVPVAAYDDNGDVLATGRYAATFEMPDSYGRPMTVDLGEVDVQHVVTRHRFVKVPVLHARVRGAGFVGRCAAVVRPGTLRHAPGSLGLVSHASCSRSTHRADVAQQVFRLRVPQLASADELVHMTVSAVVHGSGRRVVNRFPTLAARWQRTSRWSRGHSLSGGSRWHPTGWQRSSTRPGLQGRWVQVRAGVHRGVRADVERVGLRIDYEVWRTPRT